jgi:hypothetical protein
VPVHPQGLTKRNNIDGGREQIPAALKKEKMMGIALRDGR